MKLKKAVAIAAAAGALAAISVPAMAFENEFHGMYRGYGFFTNALSGGGTFQLRDGSRTDKYIEQRARLQYIAKASDDLKLITHFELDTKFGGSTGAKYVLGDSGSLDADRVSLETKNVYLDFKIPGAPIRAQVGIQPFADSLALTYGLFDGTGAVFKGSFGALTATAGYFTVGSTGTGTAFDSNTGTQDLGIADLKFAITKDISVGTSYYLLLDKIGTNAAGTGGGGTIGNSTVGLNAAAKIGPVALSATAGMQFGKAMGVTAATATALSTSGGPTLGNTGRGTTAFGATVAAKIGVGPGKVNLAALYLSGDKDIARNPNGYNKAWQSIGNGVNYFVPANMWLLTRNIATINSSTAIGGSADLTRGGRGIAGVFAGFEGAAGKVFYNTNIGYAQVAMKQNAESAVIGAELNATVGYKLYDSLSTSLTGAYAILGSGYGKDTAPRAGAQNDANSKFLPGGVRNADNPFLAAIALNYAF